MQSSHMCSDQYQCRTELLSHRFRGFDSYDATVPGLRAALAGGARHVECDVRHTLDNCLVAYHDAYFQADDGSWQRVAQWRYDDLRQQIRMQKLTLINDIVAEFTKRASPQDRLHLDIKSTGKEQEIVTCAQAAGVLEQTVFVSWLAPTLMRLHALAPQVPLCFSHISLHRYPGLYVLAHLCRADRLIPRAACLMGPLTPWLSAQWSSGRLLFHSDGNPLAGSRMDNNQSDSHAHVIPHLVTGALRDVLIASKGYVCVPQLCACAALTVAYRAAGIKTAVFSANSAAAVEAITVRSLPDLIYVDAAAVFGAGCQRPALRRGHTRG